MPVLSDATGRKGLMTDGDWILSSNMDQNGSIGVIQLKHVGVGEFLHKEFNFITEETFKELKCTEVLPGDILISRMADPVARACIVPRLSFRCVTAVDVTILRVDDDVASASYIQFLCNSDVVKQRAEHAIRGTTRARITRKNLEGLSIPLPSLPEQQRIAAILGRADRLRRLRRTARELGDTYLQSVFLEMFGDPVTNPMGWPIVKLDSIGKLDRGKSKHRPRNAPKLYGGPYPFVQTGDVAGASGYIRTYKQTYSETGLQQSKLWPSETLCITIAANIAKTAILTFEACFPDSVVGFIPNTKTNVEFIQQWFSFVQESLESTAPEVAQKNINLKILRSLDVILPPFSLQQQFADMVHKFERLRAQQREAERQAEHLFQSLLHRAFRGEL
jgi:type I restriction enzyme S subunit